MSQTKAINTFVPLEWQEEPWRDKSPVLLLSGSAGGGKCLGGDTLITMADGRRKQIVDVAVGDTVLSYSDDGLYMPGRVVATQACGEKAVVKVTTRSGYSVEASREHPIYTSRGWVKAGKLLLDDYVATARTLPFGEVAADDSYIKIVAYLIGDGSIGDTVARFHNTNDALIEDIRDAVEMMGHTLRKSGKRTYTIIGGDCRRGQNEIINRLRVDGLFGKKSKDKFVPHWVFSLPKEQVSLFLSRLYSTDGWASLHGNKATATIGYGTISKRLAYDVSDLLRKFGIVARVTSRPMFIGDKKYDDLYTVEFSSRDFVIRFIKDIGIYGKEDAVKLCLEWAASRDAHRGSDVIPQNLVVDAMSGHRYIRGLPDGVRPDSLRYKGKKSSSRENVRRYSDWLQIPELADLATSDIYWDRVKSVDLTGESAEMYDIEVSGSHNYIGNNFTLHNSQLAAEKIHGFCLKYPGSTALVLRKVRATMSNSTLLFMKRWVIGRDPRVMHRKADFRFEYSNGSILAYGGMKDDEQREFIRSVGQKGGVDICWMEEATQFEEEDFNEVLARMRGRAADWRQVILSTNPEGPDHWIHRRLILDGEASVYYSGALDNPHNAEDYIKTLSKMTGVQYRRLVLGEWCMGSGRVIDTWVDEYNAQTGASNGGNVTLEAEYIPDGGSVVWAIDDGYAGKKDKNGLFTENSHPRAILLGQLRSNGQLAIFYESYAVEMLAADHIQQVLSDSMMRGWPQPIYVVRDRAAASLEGALNQFHLRSRFVATTVDEGTNELRGWAAADSNGFRRLIAHPRCFYFRREMMSYSMDNHNKIIKSHDHGIDAVRYLAWELSYGKPATIDIVTIADILGNYNNGRQSYPEYR